MALAEKMRLYVQSIPITFESWIGSFVGVVLIRILFEQFSSFDPREPFILIDFSTLVHYGLFYLITTLAIMIILMLFAQIDIKEALAISILGLMVIWIAPIIDLVLGGIGGHIMSYLFVHGQELFIRFLTFFGKNINTGGVTVGMKIETLLGIAFCFFYTYATTKKVARSIGAAVAFYCLIFFLLATPSLIALFLPPQILPFDSIIKSIASSHIIQNNIHPNFTGTNLSLVELGFNKLMTGVGTIMALVASIFLFFIGARKKFMAFIKNSRPERLFHFFLLFMFGISLVRAPLFGNWIDIQSYVLAFMGFISASMFSICQNDIYDEKIDNISNPNRPLIAKELSREDMNTASKIFLFFTFFCAYASGAYALFFTSLFLFIYFIYSNPPLRLKKIVLLNSFLVSLACLSVILAGFFLANSDKMILSFSPGLVLAIVIFFTAVANVRDIKDIEGDKASGIKTIPVLLGEKKSKKLIAGIICFFFLLFPWYFHIPFLIIPSIIASLLSWYFITQENYIEIKGFAVYMIYLILIISVFLFK